MEKVLSYFIDPVKWKSQQETLWTAWTHVLSSREKCAHVPMCHTDKLFFQACENIFGEIFRKNVLIFQHSFHEICVCQKMCYTTLVIMFSRQHFVVNVTFIIRTVLNSSTLLFHCFSNCLPFLNKIWNAFLHHLLRNWKTS